MFDEDNVIYRYKYLKFDEESIKTLTDGTILFKSPINFNDPFDCLPYYDPACVDKIPKQRPDLLKIMGDSLGFSPAERIKRRQFLLNNIREQLENGSYAQQMIEPIGICCLTKNPLSILMWSHYANYHKGFVLEFRIPQGVNKADLPLANEYLYPLEVEYSDTRPLFDISIEDNLQQIKDLLLTKSKKWKYEEEYRVIDHDRGPGIHPYRRDEIVSSVIAGMKIKPEDFTTLKSTVRNLSQDRMPNLKLYRASEKKDAYELKIPGHPRISDMSQLKQQLKSDCKY